MMNFQAQCTCVYIYQHGYLHYFLRLGVKVLGFHVLVVDAVFLTASDADLYLKEALDLGHALKILGAGSNVLFVGLLRKIKHVRGKKRRTVLLEVLLIGIEHAIKPWQKLLRTVVRVQHDGHAVVFSHLLHVKRTLQSTTRNDLSVLLPDFHSFHSYQLGMGLICAVAFQCRPTSPERK